MHGSAKAPGTHQSSTRAHNIFQMCGVDLTRVDGIDVTTALAVVSETDADMLRFPSVKHVTSWLGPRCASWPIEHARFGTIQPRKMKV